MEERNEANTNVGFTIMEGTLYYVKKDCEYKGCQAMVERIYNGGGILATVFSRSGEVKGVKLIAADLRSMEVEGDDNIDPERKEKIYLESPNILTPRYWIKKAMEENEELNNAANIFVYEMALIGLDDEESLYEVLKKAQNRLWVDNILFEDEFEARKELDKKRKRGGGFVMEDGEVDA